MDQECMAEDVGASVNEYMAENAGAWTEGECMAEDVGAWDQECTERSWQGYSH